ncbi:MAG: hypothetical protein HKN52_07820 [Eudoraea sp.]|nr:hypothetical protein [Eudoraea sp.]
MKKLLFILGAFVLSTSVEAATSENKVAIRNAYNYNNSYIFVENGITFSVYPDGEFDFYINNRFNAGAQVNFGRGSLTFNSGYDYNGYVQYDDYGAVLQVENVPVYYDYYGRVTQIGRVDIRYNNGRVRRVGGLYVYYNRRGHFSHYTGYINIYNRHYVYRPFHRYFARPAVGFCLVYNRPYRRYYSPVRYTYYRPYRNNYRRAYAQVGRTHRYQNRYNRHSVYRNDKRVVARDNRTRRNSGLARNSQQVKRDRIGRTSSNDKARRTVTRNTQTRSNSRATTYTNGTTKRRGGQNAKGTSRKVNTAISRNAGTRTVKKRTVVTTPKRRTVSRSSATTYKRPNTARKASTKRTAVNTRKGVRKSPARSTSRSSKARSRSARTE